MKYPPPKLRHLKINPTDLCNLKCSFCPHADDTYPNNNVHMSVKTFDKILDGLLEFPKDHMAGAFDFHFTGHSEPTLTTHFKEMVDHLDEAHKDLRGMNTTLITNGARLKRHYDSIRKFDFVIYDVYTDDEDEFWDELKDHKELGRRRTMVNMINNMGKSVVCWDTRNGMIQPRPDLFVNRAGTYKLPQAYGDFDFPDYGYCGRPFKDIQINWNGDYTLCCNEWRNTPLGNVNNESITDFWMGNKNLLEYRKQLSNDVRPHPCNLCDYPGHNKYFHPSDDNEIPLIPEWQENVRKRIAAMQLIPDFPVDIDQ